MDITTDIIIIIQMDTIMDTMMALTGLRIVGHQAATTQMKVLSRRGGIEALTEQMIILNPLTPRQVAHHLIMFLVVIIKHQGSHTNQIQIRSEKKQATKKVQKQMVAARAGMFVGGLAISAATFGMAGNKVMAGGIGTVSKLSPNPVSVKLLPLPKKLPHQKKPAD